MIAVKKDFNIQPISFSKSGCQKIIDKCLSEEKYIKSDWYKTSYIKEQLNKIYKYKCAYCEGKSQAQAPFQVEHYRPKNAPKENVVHQGYYWLAYEWSNLLWSCFWCNNHKDTQFPLVNEKDRVFLPTLESSGKLDFKKCMLNSNDLVNEQALLLNPEIDKPENHLFFLPDGTIKSDTKRGNETIRICQLKRKALVISRKKIVDDFKDDIDFEIRDFLKEDLEFKDFKRNIKRIISKISKSGLRTNAYSRLGYYMFVEFELFFINDLVYNENTKTILRNIYQEFKTEFNFA